MRPVKTPSARKPGIDGEDAIEAGQQQAGADQQHQRERHLPGHQHTAHRERAVRGGARAAFLANRAGDVDVPQPQHRHASRRTRRRPRPGRTCRRRPGRRGRFRRRAAGRRARAAARPAAPTSRGSRPEAAAQRSVSTSASVRIWRVSDPSDAPSASRVTSSRTCAVARTDTRLATLSAPISSTNAANAHSSHSVARDSLTRSSWKPTTTVWKPALIRISLNCGKRSRLRALRASICCCARRQSRRRASAGPASASCCCGGARRRGRPARTRPGVHNCTSLETKRKSAGITPTMVKTTPLTRSVWPTAASCPANSRCHRP